jgi:hypothetical protein
MQQHRRAPSSACRSLTGHRSRSSTGCGHAGGSYAITLPERPRGTARTLPIAPQSSAPQPGPTLELAWPAASDATPLATGAAQAHALTRPLRPVGARRRPRVRSPRPQHECNVLPVPSAHKRSTIIRNPAVMPALDVCACSRAWHPGSLVAQGRESSCLGLREPLGGVLRRVEHATLAMRNVRGRVVKFGVDRMGWPT